MKFGSAFQPCWPTSLHCGIPHFSILLSLLAKKKPFSFWPWILTISPSPTHLTKVQPVWTIVPNIYLRGHNQPHTCTHTHTQPVGHEVVGNWRITNTGFINQKTDTVVLEEVLACPSFHQCCTVVHLTAAPATQVCGHHKTNLQIQNIHQLKWHFKFSFIQCLE